MNHCLCWLVVSHCVPCLAVHVVRQGVKRKVRYAPGGKSRQWASGAPVHVLKTLWFSMPIYLQLQIRGTCCDSTAAIVCFPCAACQAYHEVRVHKAAGTLPTPVYVAAMDR